MALTARTVTREATCPDCGVVSGRVHGGYRRRLADLAAAGQEVAIDLVVRRFSARRLRAVCTFVEQVDGLTERFARRTPRLRRSLAGRGPGWPRICPSRRARTLCSDSYAGFRTSSSTLRPACLASMILP
ncbi:transposase family protein [Streptomyces sp. NPDC051064]|uniref:transposase family protein n=1 Tax=Streptomyces sp. NPDC051064 TaxID=3365641 RepID=UPI0037A8ADB2